MDPTNPTTLPASTPVPTQKPAQTNLYAMRPTKKVILKSLHNNEVEIYTTQIIRDLRSIHETEGMERDANMLLSIIKEWTFTDAEGLPLPINKDTIGLLTSKAVVEIMNAFNEEQEEIKKNTNDTQPSP